MNRRSAWMQMWGIGVVWKGEDTPQPALTAAQPAAEPEVVIVEVHHHHYYPQPAQLPAPRAAVTGKVVRALPAAGNPRT